jgi:hypothetical protein
MNSPAEVANWRLIFLAAALAWPLFIVLNGASVTLPDSFYKVSGIPVHSSALLFLLLPKRFLKSRTELLFLLVYLSYCVLAFLDSGSRLQMTVQLGYFIYAYKILRGLNPETIRTLDRYIAIIGSAFIFIHVISMANDMMSGNILNVATTAFGFVIYQSHLTYVIVLVLVLVSVHRSFGHRPIFKLVVIVFVLIIEVVLMRRVGFALFLIFLFLFERRLLIFLLLGALTLGILHEKIGKMILEIFSFADRLFKFGGDGNFTRSMTWERSFNYLNETSTVLVGNGLHNHSHNFFLQTITTHGLIISAVFFAVVGCFIFTMVRKIGISNRYSLLAFAFVAVDWNVNVNLYQPYYSALFAFFLVSSTAFSGKKNDR